MTDYRVLVFDTQAGAAEAVASISAAMGLTGSTFLFDVPRPLADGRWAIAHPTDDAWMAGVTGCSVAAGLGLVAVGEAARPSTVVRSLALADRFTDAEMGALTLAASRGLEGGDPRLQILLDTFGRAVELDMADGRVQAGFAGLAALGILTQERAHAILSPVGLLA